MRIVLTPGEPAGIGPDLVVQLAQRALACELVVVAAGEVLEQRARCLNFPLRLVEFDLDKSSQDHVAGTLKIVSIPLARPVRCGQLDFANAGYVLESLRTATAGCLSGTFAALVTGPVHKGIINEAGIPFSGHTEFLAELTHTAQAVMMLAASGLRVALATTHLPLSKVSAAITESLLENILRVLHRDLQKYFGLVDPRILVCGLNPHAGEGGHLGREEIDVIEPVLRMLRDAGMDLLGPLPADTLFTPKYLEHADAVLAMYHDQGLPVLKHLGFGNAVNITLGLPIIRTSVDHGTALDLAGTGKADCGSLLAALDTAIAMAAQNPMRNVRSIPPADD